jgi:hypothetical protein
MLHRSRSAAAARKRRFRARQAVGVAIADVEYDCETVRMLVYLRWLKPRESHSRAEVADAIKRLLRGTTKGLFP